MDNRFDESFWTSRWVEGSTGWDIGSSSTPLITYCEGLDDLTLRILIPGGGNGYEAEYLWDRGFKNTVLLDISSIPLDHFQKRNPDFPSKNLIHVDFFAHSGEYDLILEQTFFCALDPNLRAQYAPKIHDLLAPSGKLAGVLFQFPLTEVGPPFGGSADEYRERFEPYFELLHLETCANSIAPRAGRELFIELQKMG